MIDNYNIRILLDPFFVPCLPQHSRRQKKMMSIDGSSRKKQNLMGMMYALIIFPILNDCNSECAENYCWKSRNVIITNHPKPDVTSYATSSSCCWSLLPGVSSEEEGPSFSSDACSIPSGFLGSSLKDKSSASPMYSLL